MEALWIVLGGLISTMAGVVGWYLNSRTSREVQERQQRHELDMQQERLQAERQSRQDEAIRQMRRERLQPAFAALADYERELTYRKWSQEVDEYQGKGRGGEGSDAVANIPQEERERVRRIMAKHRPSPGETLLHALSAAVRIDDDSLCGEIFSLMSLVSRGQPDVDAAVAALRKAYPRLERYAASID